MQDDRTSVSDVGAKDLKFALTGIGICVAIALILMLVS
jgi:hypothetical protein